ncbi:hypothetical protein KSW81_006894 [Nannochloris sp. 'desiccata']|nr:hypothetical protein KSW81_006894 [Chlorella desiccata (nom. nud.)]
MLGSISRAGLQRRVSVLAIFLVLFQATQAARLGAFDGATQTQQQPGGQVTTDDAYLCREKQQDPQILAELPQLNIEQILDTSKARTQSDVTLVTQLSFERLYMLEGQCDVWNGVISAAVYIALVNGQAVTVELNSNQDPQLTPMDTILSHEVENIWLSALYPVNAMRNRAIANARTDVILLLDVDFWPAAELSELMRQPGKYESLLTAVNGGSAIVLPAYETGDSGEVGVEVARESVLGGKDSAAMMFWDGRIKPFHTDRYKAGHRATDFRKWLVASRPYRIRYEEGFEPYVLVARKYVPWTDERFVGYRKNKVVHLLHLANLGLQFVVHPRAFVVHSPHPRARTWKVTHTTGLWDQLAELYRQVKEGLESNTYIPSAMYSCGNHVLGPIVPEINHISEWIEDERRR